MRLYSLLFVLLFVLLAGCGQEYETNPLHIPDDQIVWQGYANEDPRLENDLQAVLTCLRNIDESVIVRPPRADPYIIVVKDLIFGLCQEKQTSNTIYITEHAVFLSIWSIEGQREISALSHGDIHWATAMTNDQHSNIYFHSCETIMSF